MLVLPCLRCAPSASVRPSCCLAVSGRRVAACCALCCLPWICVFFSASGLCVVLRWCCLVSFVCCPRVSASCAALLSLCGVSRHTVSCASSLVLPVLLCYDHLIT